MRAVGRVARSGATKLKAHGPLPARTIICLEIRPPRGVTTAGMATSPTTLLDSLAGYPPWFVAACLTIVAAVAIWVIAKLLKWSLYLLVGLVLIGGAVATAWLLLRG